MSSSRPSLAVDFPEPENPRIFGGISAARGGIECAVSLNNDRYSAPPDKRPEIVRDSLNDFFSDGTLSGQSSLWPSDFPQDKKRSVLNSAFFEIGLPIAHQSAWQKIDLLKKEIGDQALIANTEYQPFYRYNYDHCYQNRQAGSIVSFGPDHPDLAPRVQKMNCGNPLCFWCSDRKRKKIAAEYMSFFKQCFESHGIKKIWSVVFTLPEEVECLEVSQVNEIRKQLPGVIKKTIGLKSRSNVGILVAVHPVGDSDLMRVRFHFHVLIVPLEFPKTGGPTAFDLSRINLDRLRDEYSKILPGKSDPINPEVKYFQGRNALDFSKLAHRVKYDLRSFAGDLENAMLRFTCDNKVVVLKKSSVEGFSYQAASLSDYARQSIFIIKAARIQAYGWLRQRKSYVEKGFFTAQGDDNLPLPVASAPCEIEIIRSMQYDKKLGRVVFCRAVLVHSLGKVYEVGKDIEFY